MVNDESCCLDQEFSEAFSETLRSITRLNHMNVYLVLSIDRSFVHLLRVLIVHLFFYLFFFVQ